MKDTTSLVTHKALDGIKTVSEGVPQFMEEVQAIGDKLIPSNQTTPNILINSSPTKNLDKLIQGGHGAIDGLFHTDFAPGFDPAVKDAIGHADPRTFAALPPPTVLGGNAINFEKLLEAGKVLDRGGLTKAGRGLMKHGYRPKTVFPKPIGNPAKINDHGQAILESILNHPEKKVSFAEFGRYGNVIDIQAPGIGGVRYTADGEFIGFLELPRMK